MLDLCQSLSIFVKLLMNLLVSAVCSCSENLVHTSVCAPPVTDGGLLKEARR